MASATALKVPMEVEYKHDWLTWVASTTGCLRALGVDCDHVDVAGHTGLAFLTNVHERLCPSGPTAWDWSLLLHGIHCLGRSTLTLTRATGPEGCRAAYDLVAREIGAGRPCVIWGTYLAEFGIAVGVEDGSYLVKCYREITGEPQPPIPFDQLDAPGGMYALAFPTRLDLPRARVDRAAVSSALNMLHHRAGYGGAYATSQAAYEVWIAALEAGTADPFGNSYNAQCWALAKRFARDFLGRLLERNPSVAEPLGQAIAAYTEAASAMARLAALFPFPGRNGAVADPRIRDEGIQALRAAQAAEATATAALGQAAAAWPLG